MISCIEEKEFRGEKHVGQRPIIRKIGENNKKILMLVIKKFKKIKKIVMLANKIENQKILMLVH